MGVHGGSAAGTSGLGLGGNCVQGEVSCVANVDVSALCGVLHSGVGLVSGGTTSEECSVLGSFVTTKAERLRRSVPFSVLTKYDRGCSVFPSIWPWRSWSLIHTWSPG